VTHIQTALALTEKILELHRENPLLCDFLFQHTCRSCGELNQDIDTRDVGLETPWLEFVEQFGLKQAIQDHEDALVRAQLSGIQTRRVSARASKE